jgi:hypothetical protein
VKLLRTFRRTEGLRTMMQTITPAQAYLIMIKDADLAG